MEDAVRIFRGVGWVVARRAAERVVDPWLQQFEVRGGRKFENLITDILKAGASGGAQQNAEKTEENLLHVVSSSQQSSTSQVASQGLKLDSPEAKAESLVGEQPSTVNASALHDTKIDPPSFSAPQAEALQPPKQDAGQQVKEESVSVTVIASPTPKLVKEATEKLPESAASPQLPERTLADNARERTIPSTRIGRVIGFAGLGANLAFGAVRDVVSNAFSGPKTDTEGVGAAQNMYSSVLSERNAEALAAGLCRMRGAALKVGQMLSIQDETMIPPQVQAALERVRAGADYMPRRQLERVLKNELGGDWQTRLAEFDFLPMAAASIGQVHRAILHDGRQVAMKIQYPGVAQSIESDMDNLIRMMRIANILPKGLFVENAVTVMKRELAMECDYEYEMNSQQKFKELIEGDSFTSKHFRVPDTIPDLSSKRVLTSEWVPGVAIDKVRSLSQDVRNDVGARLLHITVKELFSWRFMQTDPNWGNFLYDKDSDMLSLIDFGAAKSYGEPFVKNYMEMVKACAEKDRQEVIQRSTDLGFLTGDENQAMLDAHVEAGFIVGLPFATEGVYDFGSHSKMTGRVAELGSVMLKNRLCPPPEEVYSLHRKLSGAFLCCMKLSSAIPSRDIFYDVYRRETAV